MVEHDPAAYGDRAAAVYDELFGSLEDTEDAVSFLAEIAGPGPVLELGIGTGRLAIPLAERGIAVQGIDASRAMVDQLHSKPAGEGIDVTIGDFADVPVDGRFRLIHVAFNTFFALLTQEEQVRCLDRVRSHLIDDGAFVLEAFVPDMTRWDAHQATTTQRVEDGRVILETSRHDPVGQRIDSFGIVLTEEGIRMIPIKLRYAWPAELDLMARLAGLRLRERWGGWDRSPFDSGSTKHVSVYEPG
ncbi:MAG: class I SAM-dependent methyltransferase [Actinomycetota bacterium]|nr:class I SAM-dependent methyltransferase [Actinomycetota bacterium]